MMLADLREPAATGAALQQVREQINRSPGTLGPDSGIVVRQRQPDVTLPGFHLVPECVSDDPQLRLDYASNVTGVDWPDTLLKEKAKLKLCIDVAREVWGG